jgi:phosphatidylethanolamine-binding protein (PEBP) family uncharacterized protein
MGVDDIVKVSVPESSGPSVAPSVGLSASTQRRSAQMLARLILTGLLFSGVATSAFAFEVSSASVSDGNWDKKFVADKAGGCDGQNLSIALAWKDPPAGTKSYMLTMYDPDALGGGVGWWHWQVWNIPPTATGLPEGAGAKDGKGLPRGTVQGKGDLGRTG